MKMILQRISEAKVDVNGERVGKSGPGWLVLFGVGAEDSETHLLPMLEKLIHLRAFSDSAGKMNLSLMDIKGSLLIVSQFTLYADLSSGRRPSFTKAAAPEIARNLYEKFVALAKERGIPTETGSFGQHMEVSLINSGPVTFLIDSKEILP